MRTHSRSRHNPQEDCPPDDICYLCDAPLKDGPYMPFDPDENGYCSYACWFKSDATHPPHRPSADSRVWHQGRMVSRRLLAAAQEEGLLPVMADTQHDVAVGIMQSLLKGGLRELAGMDGYIQGAADAAASGLDWHDLVTADRRFREIAPNNYDPKRTNTHPIQTKHRKVVSRMLLGRWKRAARKSIRRESLDKAILHYRTTIKKAGLGESTRQDAIADLRVNKALLVVARTTKED